MQAASRRLIGHREEIARREQRALGRSLGASKVARTTVATLRNRARGIVVSFVAVVRWRRFVAMFVLAVAVITVPAAMVMLFVGRELCAARRRARMYMVRAAAKRRMREHQGDQQKREQALHQPTISI
jgi:uncharacterized protein YacL